MRANSDNPNISRIFATAGFIFKKIGSGVSADHDVILFCRPQLWVIGQQIWVGRVGHTRDPQTHFTILHCTYPVSHVIFWFTENQQRTAIETVILTVWLVPFHNVYITASVDRNEQTTSETHRYPWEDPNSVKILGKKD